MLSYAVKYKTKLDLRCVFWGLFDTLLSATFSSSQWDIDSDVRSPYNLDPPAAHDNRSSGPLRNKWEKEGRN